MGLVTEEQIESCPRAPEGDPQAPRAAPARRQDRLRARPDQGAGHQVRHRVPRPHARPSSTWRPPACCRREAVPALRRDPGALPRRHHPAGRHGRPGQRPGGRRPAHHDRLHDHAGHRQRRGRLRRHRQAEPPRRSGRPRTPTTPVGSATTTITDIREMTEEAPIVKLVNSVIAQSVDDAASDIHFEPQAKELVDPLPPRRRAARDHVGPAAHAERRDQPPQDHGRPRHRRAPRAAGRPHRPRGRRQAHRHARRHAADRLRREDRHAPARQVATSCST